MLSSNPGVSSGNFKLDAALKKLELIQSVFDL